MLRQLHTPTAGRGKYSGGGVSPAGHRPRPAAKSTSSEHFAADRLRVLSEVLIGAVVWWDLKSRLELDLSEGGALHQRLLGQPQESPRQKAER